MNWTAGSAVDAKQHAITLDVRPPVIFLMGPTASGKTALAVSLVECLPCDIISVDSALVYRGLDIGTAKPDAATQRRAPHRLIDLLDPAEAYSAGQFRRDALREISAIHAAGRIPLLVGGTMLYFRALEHGLAALPSADATVRARLSAAIAAQGSVALHERLVAVDPVAAARIHPHDVQRIQRALEVHELTGHTLSALCQSAPSPPLPFRIIKLVIAPSDRQVLHQRIAERFHLMLEQGFIAEVSALRSRGDLSLDKAAMRAVGYRQVWEYLDGALDYPMLINRGIAVTRQFAKRQFTWLRRESAAHWLDSSAAQNLSPVLRHLREQTGFE